MLLVLLLVFKKLMCILFLVFYLYFCFRYIFDEPSSYLDVKQRIKAAQGIRSCVVTNRSFVSVSLFIFLVMLFVLNMI